MESAKNGIVDDAGPCPECGSPLVKRWSKGGAFLGCSTYPECKYTRDLNGEENKDLVLAYLSCPQDASKGYLGALLITDARSRPLHFAYVTPIRPTVMQRLLYGATLSDHVKIDVIVTKLLQSVSTVPGVVFVDSQDLISARRVTGMPTAYLTKVDTPQEGASNLSALRYDTGDNLQDQEVVGRVLAELEPFFDLVEPFERLRDALKEAIKAPSNA